MTAYQAHGVDLMIDLEHQSLDGAAPTDPTARDARGWARLELRPDGSLWAVGVKWTADGAARLAEKRQRYVSPAFEIDPETKRVTKIVNVAITALPATHETPALIAAAARGSMDPKQVQAALDALIAGDSESAASILKDMIAAAASDPDATTEDAPPPAGDGGADEAQEPAAVATPPAPGAADPKKDPNYAAAARLARLANRSSLADALAEIETWRASHLELEVERQKLAAERSTLEGAERRKLCAELVSLGAEFPATVWSDDKATTVKPRWAKMDIAELRAHVGEQRTARAPNGKTKTPTPAQGAGDGSKTFQTSHGPVTVSAREIEDCAQAGAKPENYAANKAQREAMRVGGNAR